MKKTLRSFQFAGRGIGLLFRSQRNARIHLLALSSVFFLGWYCQLDSTDWLWLMIASGFVLTAEAFNTSIEVLTDIASPGFSARAAQVKDLAAGAVLISAIFAVVVGVLIFLPKFL